MMSPENWPPNAGTPKIALRLCDLMSGATADRSRANLVSRGSLAAPGYGKRREFLGALAARRLYPPLDLRGTQGRTDQPELDHHGSPHRNFWRPHASQAVLHGH